MFSTGTSSDSEHTHICEPLRWRVEKNKCCFVGLKLSSEHTITFSLSLANKCALILLYLKFT